MRDDVVRDDVMDLEKTASAACPGPPVWWFGLREIPYMSSMKLS